MLVTSAADDSSFSAPLLSTASLVLSAMVLGVSSLVTDDEIGMRRMFSSNLAMSFGADTTSTPLVRFAVNLSTSTDLSNENVLENLDAYRDVSEDTMRSPSTINRPSSILISMSFS